MLCGHAREIANWRPVEHETWGCHSLQFRRGWHWDAILCSSDEVGQRFVICVLTQYKVKGAAKASGKIEAKVLEPLGRGIINAGR